MKRRSLLKFLILSPGLAAIAGCGSSSEPDISEVLSTQAPSQTQMVVVSAETARNLALSGRALLLAAESLGEKSPAPLLGGAVPVNVDELTAFSETPGAFDNLQGFEQLFRAWGVQAGRPIVIYDNGAMKFAARVHFLLTHFGAPGSVLVNGGSAALAPLLSPGGSTPFSTNFQARVVNSPVRLVFQDEVLASLNSGVKIVDVRSPEEFNGQLLLPGDARPGHIPGAINLPSDLFFDSKGLIFNNEGLKALFTGAGLQTNDSIIVYCHDGAKSSLGSTLMAQVGYSNVSLYYLSYKDWSQNPALPVEL
jgi:thiosulfate/3-mercaptopyruvate sulfurtransferase